MRLPGQMHACLNVDEIIRLIAHEVVESEAEATAVALACCCKSFEDPVLDVLWETQWNLLPLLKSLPRDVWNERASNVSEPTTRLFFSLNHTISKIFMRSPTTLEWTRFRKYARRMRALEGNIGRHALPSGVFPVLQDFEIGRAHV